MVIIGAAIILVIGEILKYFMPADVLFYQLINNTYILAAAVFLLLLGLNKINLNNIKNLAASFVLILIFIAIFYQFDKVACTVLWGGQFVSVLDRVPENYITWFLLALDGVSLILGSCGAFLLLLKGLNILKDFLTGMAKSS
ncbi:hypothetical protein CUJ83_10655 [Methanocella sp. CWC-04]|uniref:Uncharacterized protein n=2 Tax=Methanooceanicella nereidis TaxID=2052831 RepID=A0AAP2RDB4_9EURY|nr:hypothetical protein [Methanocella sp. CWC-04]